MRARREFLGAAILGALTGYRPASGQTPAEPPARRQVLKPVGPGANPVVADERVNRLLDPLRERRGVPALAAALVAGGQLAAIGAVGVRKLGGPSLVAVNDRFHLGSCTKAMTATMIGTLVDEGKLSWDSSIGEVFLARAKNLHPDCRAITLTQLLAHRAGLPANGPWWMLGRKRSTTDQRRILLSGMLKDAPQSNPGTKFEYSNVGYAIAGLMAEEATGQSWEILMRKRLFEPLGMRSAGFGAPGKPGGVSEPWGHREIGGKLEPVQEDNAPALGPAGTVHASLPDWAKFAILHLEAEQGRPSLLTTETFRALHVPKRGETYVGGWGTASRTWARGRVLTHKGSNTTWYATIWMAPARNLAILAATNQAGDAADLACDEATQALIALHDGTPSSPD